MCLVKVVKIRLIIKMNLRRSETHFQKTIARVITRILTVIFIEITLAIKVGCVFPMIIVTILVYAEFGQNDHREDAPTLFLKYLPSWLSTWLSSVLASSFGWFFFLAAWAAFFSFSLCFFSAAFWAFVFTVGPSSCVLSSVLFSPSGSSLGSSFLPLPFLPFFFFLSSSEAHSASRSSTVAGGWGFASVLASPFLGFTTVWFTDLGWGHFGRAK